jgi:uroporphyrinogen decarboxylase
LKRLVEGINKLGLPAMMHNDGQIWDVLDDLADCGIVSLHPVERAASMDLKTVKQRYKGRFIPIGNVNNKTTMSIGTPDEVEAETRECLSIGMPGGGYIIATDHSIHDGIPVENVLRFIDTVKKYGVY